jgi:hypothetical protein
LLVVAAHQILHSVEVRVHLATDQDTAPLLALSYDAIDAPNARLQRAGAHRLRYLTIDSTLELTARTVPARRVVSLACMGEPRVG